MFALLILLAFIFALIALISPGLAVILIYLVINSWWLAIPILLFVLFALACQPRPPAPKPGSITRYPGWHRPDYR